MLKKEEADLSEEGVRGGSGTSGARQKSSDTCEEADPEVFSTEEPAARRAQIRDRNLDQLLKAFRRHLATREPSKRERVEKEPVRWTMCDWRAEL